MTSCEIKHMDQVSQFSLNVWFLMALDIIDAKLFKEHKQSTKRSCLNADVISFLKLRLLTL